MNVKDVLRKTPKEVLWGSPEGWSVRDLIPDSWRFLTLGDASRHLGSE
jgi:hypothetical protein